MNRRTILALPLAATALASASTAAAPTPRLAITPARVLEGDPVSIRATGLAPGETVVVWAVSSNGAGRAQVARASFVVGASGVLDLAKDAPASGTYAGADIRGLFWSPRPLDAGTEAALEHWPGGAPKPEPGVTALALERGGVIVDRASLTLLAAESVVAREDVRTEGLIGRFYVRRGARRRPPVLILGGAEGGLSFGDWLGPRLASRGYAALAIAYFSPDGAIAGLPKGLQHIPVELAQRAHDWLARRPEANAARLGVVGASKGGEFALLIAATYPWVRATVAYVPADYVWQGFQYGSGEAGAGSSWSKDGRDLPFIPETGQRDAILAGRKAGGGIRLAPVHEKNFQAASQAVREAARIPIERSRSALLMLGGADDQTGGSGAAVMRIEARLKAARYPHPFTAISYPGAGHLIVGDGWRPTTDHNTGVFLDGGAPDKDARAQADGWSRMLDFLARRL
jgi:dienelactone hydrolase